MKLEWYGFFAYCEENVKKMIIDKGGNYVISIGLQDGNYRPIYVGKTKYLKDRLLKHLSNDEENECIKGRVGNTALYFIYCYVSSQEDRENTEHTLYKKYIPECNKVVPEGKEITITFPY